MTLAFALMIVSAFMAGTMASAGAAATTRPFVTAFRASPVFSPTAVAVDQASGEVFLGNPASGAIEVFSASGEYLESFGEGLEIAGLAVDPKSGDVFVAEPFRDSVMVFGHLGSGGWQLLSDWAGANTPAGSFAKVGGIAIDSSTSETDPGAGDVYVLDSERDGGRGGVDVFEAGPSGSEGALVRTLSGGRLEGPNALAVSAASGRLFVADSAKGAVDVYEPSGVFERRITGSGSPVGSFRGKHEEGGNVTGLAIDESTGGLLVVEGQRGIVGEFDSDGAWRGWITGTDEGPFSKPDAVAASVTGRVYVADSGTELVDVFGPSAPVPDVTTGHAARVTASSVELKGVVANLASGGRYWFEWGTGETYGSVTSPVATSGSAKEAVRALLMGLQPDTTYRFRLVAEDENGLSCGLGGAFTTAPGEATTAVPSRILGCELPRASVDGESVDGVSTDAATLQAWIDPRGRETTYSFEYGTGSCVDRVDTCEKTPPADAGGGEAEGSVSVPIAGLLPDTTYHYRALATNSLGTTEGAQQTFTTAAAPGPFALPDGRAWEMVSPLYKQGAPIEALTREGGVIRASENGDQLTYVADGAITEETQGNRAPEMQQLVSTRGPGEWTTADIETPQTRAQGDIAGSAPEYQFFAPDLSLALVDPPGVGAEPPLAEAVNHETMYVRDSTSGTYTPLVTEWDAPEATFPAELTFLDASQDLSHVVFYSAVALLGPKSAPGLYEWIDGRLQYVSELPSGAPAGEAALGYYHVAARALSSDGTALVWTDSAVDPAQLFLRDTATNETVRLDAAQGTTEPEYASARFQTASADDSRVFFTDKQRLTADAGAEPEGAGDVGRPDLYECEMNDEGGRPSCRLNDLTPPVRKGEPADVQGMVFGASEDGTSLYFVADGILSQQANGEGHKAESGMNNLYLLRRSGTEWRTTFIATLSGNDEPEWSGNGQSNTAFLTARVSPNGGFLAFMSSASLAGYDTEDITSRQRGERLDEEVYLYDATGARLTCVSCDPTGARPAGVLDAERTSEGLGLLVDRREVWLKHWLAGSIPGWTAESLTSALIQPRYLSDEGRLFFDSPGDLVPQATNNKEDVYEYEPAGVGDCQSEARGCVALISSGSSPNESAFLEATPSGDDAFILTTAQLTPQDTDNTFDVYDARVCTPESPCLTPATQAPACESAIECHVFSPASSPPREPAGSATFLGPHNPEPAALAAPLPVTRPAVSPKPLSQAEKLAQAVRKCRKQHSRTKRRRKECETRARKLYGPKRSAKRSSQTHAKTRTR